MTPAGRLQVRCASFRDTTPLSNDVIATVVSLPLSCAPLYLFIIFFFRVNVVVNDRFAFEVEFLSNRLIRYTNDHRVFGVSFLFFVRAIRTRGTCNEKNCIYSLR